MAKRFGPGDDWSRRIQDIMDEMRNRSFCDYRASGSWLPTINIYSSRVAYLLCVELAGLDGDAVSVVCPDERHVRISGQRGQPQGPGQDEPFSIELMEIDDGPFLREVDFGEPIDVHRVEAVYDKGYLWIRLPKMV